MRRIVVLAGSLREANAYCRDQGIRAVFAQTPEQVKLADHIIELPGFAGRRDKFALVEAMASRMKYGKDVTYVSAADWVAPKWRTADDAGDEYEMLEGQDVELPVDETATAGIYELDLTEPDVREALKAELNKIGFTLKKLPAKTAPVVDAPVEF